MLFILQVSILSEQVTVSLKSHLKSNQIEDELILTRENYADDVKVLHHAIGITHKVTDIAPNLKDWISWTRKQVLRH